MYYKNYEITILTPDIADYDKLANQALDICDEFLGQGLYSRERIDDICHRPHHYFYLITEEDEVMGIFYCYATLYEDIDFLKDINVKNIGDGVRVGVGQSIALKPEARKHGVSEWILNYCTDFLFEKEKVRAIFIPAWKTGDEIPAKGLLSKCSYEFIGISKQPWAKHENLSCPVCKHFPCICDGVIYAKKENSHD